MATKLELIQQTLSALLQKIPDAQQQQANDDRKLAANEEMAKLSAEVKLLSVKLEEKCAMEKVNNQNELFIQGDFFHKNFRVITK